MLVEFCGTTGSGKSTLAKKTVHHLANLGAQAVLADDLMLEALRLDRRANGVFRRATINLLATWQFLRHVNSNYALATFSAKALWQETDSFWLWSHLYRNVIKRLGVHLAVRCKPTRDRIVIVDEGTLHIVHNLFVHVNSDPDLKQVLEFAYLVPLPDLIVFVQTPVELCVERTLQRGHRRIATNSRSDVENFVMKAHRVFEYVASVERVNERLVTVDNSNPNSGSTSSVAYGTAMSILKRLPISTPGTTAD